MRESPKFDIDSSVVTEINLGDLWRAACQAKWMILGIAGAATILAIIVVSIMPNQYTASMTVDPGSRNEKIGYQILAAASSAEAAPDVAAALNLQVEINSHVKLDLAKQLKNKIKASFDKRTGFLEISVTYSDANIAAKAVKEYFEYIKKFVSDSLLSEESRRLVQLDGRLKLSQEALLAYEKENAKHQRILDEQVQFMALAIGEMKAELSFVAPQNVREQLVIYQENLLKINSFVNSNSLSKQNETTHKSKKVDGTEFIAALDHRINVEYHRSLIRKLKALIEQARAEDRLGFRQIGALVVPLAPSSPGRALTVATVFVISLVLALLLAFVIDRRRIAQS